MIQTAFYSLLAKIESGDAAAQPPETDFIYLPDPASDYAHEIKQTFYIEYGICLFWGLLIFALTAYFCVKYRRRSGNEGIPPHITHNWPLEIAWTIIPTIIVFWMFYVGAKGYLTVNIPPENARSVEVIARQWSWEFRYLQDGRVGISDKLILEEGQPVQIVLQSEDVLHSFYVPSFGNKIDAVPKRVTKTNFTPTKPGTYALLCTEYCGKDHSTMTASVHVYSKEDYKMAMEGVFKAREFEALHKQYCAACHSLDGTKLVGPSFKGLWGKTESVVDSSGSKSQVEVNEEYLIESIRKPSAKVVEGYANAMAPYGPSSLSDDEIKNIIEGLKELKE